MPAAPRWFSWLCLGLCATLLAGCAGRGQRVDGIGDADSVKDAGSSWVARGQASWYGGKFHGRKTASGETFNRHALTAAHPSLPFGARLCVRSMANGKTVVVRINDRGPSTKKRIIDVSEAAAKTLDMLRVGVVSVELWRIGSQSQHCPARLPPLPNTSRQR